MNLPREIIDYILELKESNEHYERMRKIIQELPIRAAVLYLTNKLSNIEDLTTKDERIFYAKIFEKCKCCERHQFRRPTATDYINGYLPSYPTTSTRTSCRCICRTSIRNFCLIDNDEISEDNYHPVLDNHEPIFWAHVF
tara:strand:- start:224 stop:643 length:420 start_codon:yes stop_codon:yes gene_type:complete